jgi:hypothetical protein
MSEIYYGTKRITAEPEEKNGNQGYGVVYEDGYKSWSPRSTFEEAYRKSGEMNFGHALMALNEGRRVARSGWNGKRQFIFRTRGSTHIVDSRSPLAGAFPNDTRIEEQAHLRIKSAQGTTAPWVASQTDLLAEDWEIVA